MRNHNNYRKRYCIASKEIKKLNAKLKELLKKSEVVDIHEELLGIMGEHNHSVQQSFLSNNFRQLF